MRLPRWNAARTAAAALVPVALVVAACASGSGGSTGRSAAAPVIDQGAAPDSTPIVRVINDRQTPMDVHLEGNGQTRFLGTVAAFDTLSAPVPEGMLGTSRRVRLRATPLGGGRASYSGEVYLEPGDVLEWTITSL